MRVILDYYCTVGVYDVGSTHNFVLQNVRNQLIYHYIPQIAN
jgi:hypothetical protein